MPSPADQQKVHENQERKQKTEHAISKLENHIHKTPDGTLELRVKDAQAAGVDPMLFDELKRSLDETNRRLKSGELRLDEVRLKTPMTP